MRTILAVLLLAAFAMPSFAQGPRPSERRGRGPDRAPAEGARIPAVSAKTPDGSETIDLNKPERLTVLVFGSHT